mgnify:FL=1
MFSRKLVGLMAVAGMFFAGTASAQIANTAHDFSGDTWSGGEICVVCHAPHNNAATVSGAPLWNHALTTTTGFTPYDSNTFNATAGNPSGTSLLCLSCHDGTVALDSFGGTTGTTFLTGADNLGKDLSNDHPISFAYDTALATADGELFDPATATTALGGTIAADLLFGGSMECASCHDVHGTGNTALLLIPNTGSDLCLTCHNK